MCRGRKDFVALLRIIVLLFRKIEIEYYKFYLGNKKFLKGMIEFYVGIIKFYLGILKFVGVLKKFYVNISLLQSYTLRNFVVFVVIIFFINQTFAKVVARLYGYICIRFSCLSENYVSIGLIKYFYVIVMDSRRSDMGVLLFVGFLLCLIEFDTNRCRQIIVKYVKRRRDRELFRLSMKKVLRFMKKRKYRCKVKDVVRKSILKLFSLYSVVIDYKLWYVRYNNRFDCFFVSFFNFKGLIGKKIFYKSK